MNGSALAAVSVLMREGFTAAWRRVRCDSVTGSLAGAAAVVGTACTGVWAVSTGGYFWPRWVWLALVVALGAQFGIRLAVAAQPGWRRQLAVHSVVFGVYIPMDIAVWLLSGRGFFWPIFGIVVLCATLGTHLWVVTQAPDRERQLTDRIATMARGRRRSATAEAMALQRIERDLHDGAQARLIALGITAALAEELVDSDPAEAVRLLREVRTTADAALTDLRETMAEIRPPVLADRGLVGALTALSLDLPLPIHIDAEPGLRIPAAVEPVGYFCAVEALSNVMKHAEADHVTIAVAARDHAVQLTVTDDGVGGAEVGGGSGLAGLRDRLATFDGTMELSSPTGGPTSIVFTIPIGQAGRR